MRLMGVVGQSWDDRALAVEYRAVLVEIKVERFMREALVPRRSRQAAWVVGKCGEEEASARIVFRAALFDADERAVFHVYDEPPAKQPIRQQPREESAGEKE